MPTFVQDKSDAFKKRGDPSSLPSKRRSESRVKNYVSATDARAWCNHIQDNKEYIIDLISAEFPKGVQIGKYVPVEALISTLMANKNADIVRLKDHIRDLENFIKKLHLSPEEAAELKKIRASWGAGDEEPVYRKASTSAVPKDKAKKVEMEKEKKPLDSQKEQRLESQKDQLLDSQKDRPSDSQKDKPLDSQRAQPLDSQRAKSLDSQEAKSLGSQKGKSSVSIITPKSDRDLEKGTIDASPKDSRVLGSTSESKSDDDKRQLLPSKSETIRQSYPGDRSGESESESDVTPSIHKPSSTTQSARSDGKTSDQISEPSDTKFSSDDITSKTYATPAKSDLSLTKSTTSKTPHKSDTSITKSTRSKTPSTKSKTPPRSVSGSSKVSTIPTSASSASAISKKEREREEEIFAPGIAKDVGISNVPDMRHKEVDSMQDDCEVEKEIARRAILELEALEDIIRERDELKEKLKTSEDELKQIKEKDSCQSDIGTLEKEFDKIKDTTQPPALEMIDRELQLLKKCCEKLTYIKLENKQLKDENNHLKKVCKCRSSTDVQTDSEFTADEERAAKEKHRQQVEELNEKVAKLNEVSKERDALRRSIAKLEQEVQQCDDLNSKIRERSKMLDDALEERNDLQRRLDRLPDLQQELKLLKQKADRVDELERLLMECKAAGLCSCPDLSNKAVITMRDYEKLVQKEKEAEILRIERDKLKLNCQEAAAVRNTCIALKNKCRMLEAVTNERDVYKTRSRELTFIEADYQKLKNRLEEIQCVVRQRDCLVHRIKEMQAVICDQECEINRMVTHIDRLSQGQDKQQDRTKQAICELRAELEMKNMIIAESEVKLASVQEQLKDTILKLKGESAMLKKKVVTVESSNIEITRKFEVTNERFKEIQNTILKEKDYSNQMKDLLQEKDSIISDLQSELEIIIEENDKLQNVAGQTDAGKLQGVLNTKVSFGRFTSQTVKKYNPVLDTQHQLKNIAMEIFQRKPSGGPKSRPFVGPGFGPGPCGICDCNAFFRTKPVQKESADQTEFKASTDDSKELDELRAQLKICHAQLEEGRKQQTDNQGLLDEIDKLKMNLEQCRYSPCDDIRKKLDDCKANLEKCLQSNNAPTGAGDDQTVKDLKECRLQKDALSNQLEESQKQIADLQDQLKDLRGQVKDVRVSEKIPEPKKTVRVSQKIPETKRDSRVSQKTPETKKDSRVSQEVPKTKEQVADSKAVTVERASSSIDFNSNLVEQLDHYKRQNEKLQKDNENLMRQIESFAKPGDCIECEKQLQDLKNQKDDLTKKLETAIKEQKDCSEYIEQLKKANEKIDQLQIEANNQKFQENLKKNLEDMKKQLELCENQNETLNKKLRDYEKTHQESLLEYERKHKQSLLENEKLEGELQKSHRSQSQLQEDQANTKQRSLEVEGNLEDVRKQLREARLKMANMKTQEDFDALLKQLNECQEQAAQIKEKPQELVTQIKDKPQELVTQIKEKPQEQQVTQIIDKPSVKSIKKDDSPDLLKQLEECKAKLSSMKSQEDFNKLQSQLEDSKKQAQELKDKVSSMKSADDYNNLVKQLEQAKAQALDAKQKGNLASADCTEYIKKLEQCQKELEATKEKMAQGDRSEVDKLKKQLDQCRKELDSAKTAAGDNAVNVRKQLDECNEALKASSNELTVSRTQIDGLKEQLKTCTKSLEDCRKQLEESKRLVDDHKKQLEDQKKLAEGYKKQMEDQKKLVEEQKKLVEDQKKLVEEHKKKLSGQKKVSDDQNRLLLNQKKQMDDQKNQLENMRKHSTDVQKKTTLQMDELKRQLEKGREQLQAANAKAIPPEDFESCKKQLADVEGQLDKCLKDKSELGNQLSSALLERGTLSKTEATLGAYKKRIAELEAQLEQVTGDDAEKVVYVAKPTTDDDEDKTRLLAQIADLQEKLEKMSQAQSEVTWQDQPELGGRSRRNWDVDEYKGSLSECETRLHACEAERDRMKKQLVELEHQLEETMKASMQAIQATNVNYKRDVNALKERYSDGVMSLQKSHEEIIDQTQKEHEAELEAIKRNLEEMSCRCRKPPRMKPKLVQTDSVEIAPQGNKGGADALLNNALQKALQCGLQSLTPAELQRIMGRLSRLSAGPSAGITRKNGRRNEGDGPTPPCDLKRRQAAAQNQVAQLQLEVAAERERLENLKRMMQMNYAK